jgi:hypothetical protein
MQQLGKHSIVIFWRDVSVVGERFYQIDYLFISKVAQAKGKEANEYKKLKTYRKVLKKRILRYRWQSLMSRRRKYCPRKLTLQKFKAHPLHQMRRRRTMTTRSPRSRQA